MPSLFIIGLLSLLTFISLATWRTNQMLSDWTTEENILLSIPENIARLVIIILSIGLGFLSRESLQTLGWRPPHPLGDILLGSTFGIFLSLALYYPSLWVEKHHPSWYSDLVIRSIRPRSPSEWPWVALAFLPIAVMEELLFRSLLLGAFAPHVNIIYFVIGVSVIFGLLHLRQGEWGVTGAILISLLLSFLFLWRESIMVVITAHWFMNVAQVALDALTPDG